MAGIRCFATHRAATSATELITALTLSASYRAYRRASRGRGTARAVL